MSGIIGIVGSCLFFSLTIGSFWICLQSSRGLIPSFWALSTMCCASQGGQRGQFSFGIEIF